MDRNHEVDASIDAITDCLTEAETGKTYPTDYRQITKKITAKTAKELIQAGWRFDWSLPQKNGFQVIKLSLKDSSVLGLLEVSSPQATRSCAAIASKVDFFSM